MGAAEEDKSGLSEEVNVVIAEPAVGRIAEVAVDPEVDDAITVSVFSITLEVPNEDDAVFTESSVVTGVEA